MFFEFVHEGKNHKIKKREGVNRFKTVEEREKAISELQDSIESYLSLGWNPITDPNRKMIKQKIFMRYYLPDRTEKVAKKKSKAFEYFYKKH